MEKEENYLAGFPSIDYSLDPSHQLYQPIRKARSEEAFGSCDNVDINHGMTDYMLHSIGPVLNQNQYMSSSGNFGSGSLDKLSFADVMQFSDFGPKLALNQYKSTDDETGDDSVCCLEFPVLGKKLENQSLIADMGDRESPFEEDVGFRDEEEAGVSDNLNLAQLQEYGDQDLREQKSAAQLVEAKNNKRKRPRVIKTSEEVESQRMMHIAVERNRRRQMNEHLRVLRSLMPGSYVQRGDQASIIGGAIEFVRELEQLLQCLESQKRRRLYGDRAGAPSQVSHIPPKSQFYPQNNNTQTPGDEANKLVDVEIDTGLREETAESKSSLADIDVKVMGFDVMIKILSRRRPGQLIKTIAALEDLQLNILHTNITTIEHTVLYSFNVKVASETRFTAEDIACSVQQIFSFIHASSSM